MSVIKLGICQMPVTASKEQNLSRARQMAAEAARAGARVVVLPEMFNCPYQHEFFTRFAETCPDGDTFRMLTSTARELGVYLIGGSIPEAEDGRTYNTCFVYGPDGRMLGRQRKLHLFNIETDDLVFRESDTLSPGTGPPTVFVTPLVTFGVAICFDLRFPELFRDLAARGAELIVAPAAFNTFTGPPHWELLLRARAVDNQVFVAGAGPAWTEDSPYPYYGHSLVVNPWAEVIAGAGERETVLLAEIDLGQVAEVRKKLPLHRTEKSTLIKF